ALLADAAALELVDVGAARRDLQGAALDRNRGADLAVLFPDDDADVALLGAAREPDGHRVLGDVGADPGRLLALGVADRDDDAPVGDADVAGDLVLVLLLVGLGRLRRRVVRVGARRAVRLRGLPLRRVWLRRWRWRLLELGLLLVLRRLGKLDLG